MKEVLAFLGTFMGIVWRSIIVVMLYVAAMWALLVTAVFLYLKDFWASAGIVSAIVLFLIVRSEFNKEFFGARTPEAVSQNAIQKQS